MVSVAGVVDPLSEAPPTKLAFLAPILKADPELMVYAMLAVSSFLFSIA